MTSTRLRRLLVALSCLCTALFTSAAFAQGQEVLIRKNLSERLHHASKIDEVRRTPMAGLFEVRMNGTDLYYTDAEGSFLIEGSLTDLRSQRNLTEERMNKLLAIDFKALPLKDAFTIVRGNGERKVAVFEDPNCGYCKRFERDLQNVNNITVYLFLYPILGADSGEKSSQVWCAKDRAKAWIDLMVKDQPLGNASCDTGVLQRNLAWGHKNKITGTPTLFLSDGTRIPGAISASQLEKMLASVGKS